MDYQKIKKSLIDIKKDIYLYPGRTTLIVIIMMIIFLGSALAPVYFSNLFSEKDIKPENSTAAVSNQQLYFGISTEKIVEDNNEYVINAEYPVFNIPILDKKIKDLISAQIVEFKEWSWNGYARNNFSVHFENVYIDSDIVSFRLTVDKYIGGAHGMTEYFSFNCNRKTGYFYTIDDLKLLTGLTLNDLEKEAARSLEKQSKTNEYYPSSFDGNSGLEAKPSNYAVFTISKDDLTFWFQEYQVVSRVAGNPSFSVKRLRQPPAF